MAIAITGAIMILLLASFYIEIGRFGSRAHKKGRLAALLAFGQTTEIRLEAGLRGSSLNHNPSRNLRRERMKMQRTALVSALALVGAISAAQAQTNLGVLVRAGLFSPTDGEARNLGEAWFTGGAEISLGKFPFMNGGAGRNPLKLTFSVDAYSKEGASAVPVLANVVQYTSKNFFWSAGVGGAATHRSGFKDAFQLAYQIGVGYDFGSSNSPITLQARFFSVNEVGSLLDGFAFTVGIRL